MQIKNGIINSALKLMGDMYSDTITTNIANFTNINLPYTEITDTRTELNIKSAQGRLSLIPTSGSEGGELRLCASEAHPDMPGVIIDNYDHGLRIYPIPAKDGSSPTSWSQLFIDLYNKTIQHHNTSSPDQSFTFVGSVEGNSSTATTLKTARSVLVNLASETAGSFNGTADINPGVSGILPVTHGGTGTNTVSGILSILFPTNSAPTYFTGFDSSWANGKHIHKDDMLKIIKATPHPHGLLHLGDCNSIEAAQTKLREISALGGQSNINESFVCRVTSSNWDGALPSQYGTIVRFSSISIIGGNYMLWLCHFASKLWYTHTNDSNWPSSETVWNQVYSTAGKPTPADIGAATSNHTHDYLPLTNGYVTKTLMMTGSSDNVNEGAEIHLYPNVNNQVANGIAIDQQNNNLRIFGIPSRDGTTVTGTGTVLYINPYTNLIHGEYELRLRSYRYSEGSSENPSYANVTAALHMSNSNIKDVNSIYFADPSNDDTEGIHFPTTTISVFDTIVARDQVLYFVPGRTLGTTVGNRYKVYHEGNKPTLTDVGFPTCNTSNNGQILRVVNGAPAWETVSAVETATF